MRPVNAPPEALEPVTEVEPPKFDTKATTIHPGLVLRVKGRSVRLRGLKREPSGILRWLAILGPGLVAGAVSNDAGSIATYSQAGAKVGYELLWVILLITVSLIVVQEMAARLGAASGRGLLDLIRERFGLGWSLLAVTVIMIANGGLVISEFVGIGAAAEIFGVSKYLAIPLAGGLLTLLVLLTNYNRVEKIFLVMTLVFLAYPAAALLAHPNAVRVAQGTFVPALRMNAEYISLLVGLIGTTISPYQLAFQQSAVVEKGVARRHYTNERIDTIIGMAFSMLITFSIIVATAATLHAHGITAINSAADAARALEPVLGPAAKTVFGVGLLGASLMAAAVLPLATAYSVSETFGFPKGMNLDFRRARIFFGLFMILMLAGAGVALIPNLPIIQLLVGIQVLNGILLPIILVFVLLLINDRRVVRELGNTVFQNVLGWATLGLIAISILALLAQQLPSGAGI